jgi:hypothetical protein
VYIQLTHRIQITAVATGKYCNNYNAEAAALRHAADALIEHNSYARDKVVISTDFDDRAKKPKLK